MSRLEIPDGEPVTVVMPGALLRWVLDTTTGDFEVTALGHEAGVAAFALHPSDTLMRRALGTLEPS